MKRKVRSDNPVDSPENGRGKRLKKPTEKIVELKSGTPVGPKQVAERKSPVDTKSPRVGPVKRIKQETNKVNVSHMTQTSKPSSSDAASSSSSDIASSSNIYCIDVAIREKSEVEEEIVNSPDLDKKETNTKPDGSLLSFKNTVMDSDSFTAVETSGVKHKRSCSVSNDKDTLRDYPEPPNTDKALVVKKSCSENDTCNQQREGGTPDARVAFITVETNDGQSSRKIPISQFLKNVTVDKESGQLTYDISHLLQNTSSSNTQLGLKKTDVCASEPEQAMANIAEPMSNSNTNTSMQSTVALHSVFEPQTTVKQEMCVSGVEIEVKETDKPLRRRGRPPKNKPQMKLNIPEVKSTLNTLIGSDSNSKSCESNNSVVTSSTVAAPAVKHDQPRRSSRTPARNSRFGDDYVDSTTLGKISSSSTWNTQLMTLALAAETHKNKPQKCNNSSKSSKCNGDQSVEKADESDDDDDDNVNSDVERDDTEDKMTGDEETESDNEVDDLEQSATSINGKVMSNVDKAGKKPVVKIRGPKTKKYEPVQPVVWRSLNDALNLSLESTQNQLNTKTPEIEEDDNAGNSMYFTIMEPKIEASGHGLLVNKASDGVAFRIVDFTGDRNLLNTTLPVSNNSYPQERYFSCADCDKIFPSTSSWLQHIGKSHSKTMKTFEKKEKYVDQMGCFSCQYCDQKFPYKFMLDIHMRRKRHSEIKTFRCTLCKENFSTHKAREEHWMMAHPARSCALCGKQFTNIVMLRRHINHSCHGARFRKRTSASPTCAEENMIEPQDDVHHPSPSKTLPQSHDSDSECELGTVREIEEEKEQESDVIKREISNGNTSGAVEKSNKILCSKCEKEFSTYSGLWHHKMESHLEYFPEKFKEKLREKLEKNQAVLQSAPISVTDSDNSSSRNTFFTIMRPKWPLQVDKLTVGVSDKTFTFKPQQNISSSSSSQSNEMLPKNSHADEPQNKDTIFNCSECDETFEFASNYREHRSRAHGECFETIRLLGAFQCSSCSETYPCQFMLDKHLKKHVGKKRLPCTLCGLYFHKIQERRLHWKSVHPGIGCPNCGKMYASIKYLQKHISLNCQDHFPPTKKFLEFQKKQHSDFELDESEKKLEKKIIRCHLCPKVCCSVHGWRRHMSDAHEDVGFSKLSNTCIICNQVVYGYKALEKHLLKNHAVDSGVPVEEEDDIVQEAMKKSKVDMAAYNKAGRSTSEIYQDEEKNYHCPHCPKTHTEMRALKTHMKTHVNMKLVCRVCQKTFKNPNLLKQHVQRHRKEAVYCCETCNKRFLTLPKLEKHRKVHHSRGNFVCEVCGMSFALNDYLLKHKKCHTEERPHVCNVCLKTFRTKAELRIHVVIHTRENPFKCQFCERGFSQRGNYRIHLAQHTGEKPYKCDQCEVSFALHCHLKRHMATHDQKINYRCAWCDKECTQRKHMQMHVQRVHKEDFFQSEEQMKLETPIPIAPSQLKLYNRRLGKMNKVRKQYKRNATLCESTSKQLMDGMVITKSELIEEGDEGTPQSILIEPMIENVSGVVGTIPQNAGFEILVSDDHQSYARHTIPSDIINHDASNVEIVMGENNEINIIIKDPAALQEVVDSESSISTFTIDDLEKVSSVEDSHILAFPSTDN